MENQNCEILFEYLRSIIYDIEPKPLELDTLDEPFQKLGRGLQYLDHAVREMKAYTADLSTGNLSGPCPERDNGLCVNLKNLHANLNHLTWQAKQVAAGDYSQHVSYLGEFSDAFNTMTKQLCERETLLKQEAEKEKHRASLMQGYHDMLLEMMCKSNEHILVTDGETGKIVYGNQRESYPGELHILEKAIAERADHTEKTWETQDDTGRIFRVITSHIEWQGRSAYAHILRDITEEKRAMEKLTDQAYSDSLTGIGNRLFFREQTQLLLDRNTPFALCYFDLDHLKYINDTFGHAEGDAYLRSFASIMKTCIRENDIFARLSGDEFCAVFAGQPANFVHSRIEQIAGKFTFIHCEKYPASFSCGIVTHDCDAKKETLVSLLSRADAAMYEQKRVHRKAYEKELRR